MVSDIQRQLVVFDFDWSMADQDTDRWVFEVLAPDIRRKMKSLKDEIQWTDLVAQSLEELHQRGKTKEDIEYALRIMPFHPAMVRAISNLKNAFSPTTTFFCLSNANSVFISTILESKGLLNVFEEIITNPASFEPSGEVDPTGPQHLCKVGCSPNMCKGEELEAFLARHQPAYDRIIYIGDGANDFCPILRMRRIVVLCRRFRGLERRIAQEGEKEGLKCQVRFWAGAWEVEEIFGELSN
ncbi:phosphatase phospho-type [Pisolithus orientalis]|uniref:phosphatase phospho-type n=1 Tax=Pisolithus orientalis TaxID=936130 RepID=UPI00222589E3|nr:phosphatase phospho-type [Pisolithus orientalis]KAI6032843.1 phosphatase phospho-type [Pisolithus orientalis]